MYKNKQIIADKNRNKNNIRIETMPANEQSEQLPQFAVISTEEPKARSGEISKMG